MLVTDLKERFADAAANELRAQRDTIRTLRTELTPELLDEALALALERLPEQPDEARTVLEHTQELLTYARSSRAAGTQPLYAEIDATQSYFALARLQYGDRFTVNTDIPTALYDVPVAGFTVQPLAAHTLHHRLRTDEADTCTLTIRARSNDAMCAYASAVASSAACIAKPPAIASTASMAPAASKAASVAERSVRSTSCTSAVG